MYIFIDEAGIFIDPNNRDRNVVSTVGAIVIPHQSYTSIMEEFKQFKERWHIEGEKKVANYQSVKRMN